MSDPDVAPRDPGLLYPRLPGGLGAATVAFVGRKAELGALQSFVDGPTKESGRLLLLTGESGIGKTRLIDEFHRVATTVGMLQLSAQCEGIERGVPYAPWIDLLRQFVREQPRGRVRSTVVPCADAVFALLPELTDKVWLTPSPDWRAHPLDGHSFVRELCDLFIAIAGSGSALITIDDLALADASSVELLQAIAPATRTNPLFIAVSARDTHLDQSPPLKELVLTLGRSKLITRVDLARLDRSEVAALVGQLLRQAVPLPEFVRLVNEKSGGNPFFVEEIVQSLIESGAIFPTADGWEGRSVPTLRVPSSVQSVLEQRLGRLGTDHRTVLAAAAAEGPEFHVRLLPQISGRGEKDVLDAIEAAAGARLVQVVRGPAGDDVGTFAHPLIQEALYAEVPLARRREIHHRIGLALESSPPGDSSDRSGILAYHFLRSGDTARALEYCMKAGDRAAQIYARRDAIEHYRAALDLLSREPAGSQRWRIQSRLAEQMIRVGDAGKGLDLFEEAADGFQRLGDLAAAVGCIAAMGTNADITPDRAEPLFRRATALLGESPEDSLLGQVLVARSNFLYVLGRVGPAREDAERALRLAEAQGDRHGQVLTRLISARSLPVGRIRDSFRLVREAKAIAEDHGLTDLVIEALTYQAAAIYHVEGDLPRALDASGELIELARRTGTADIEAWWRGYAEPLGLLRQGHFTEVVLRADELRRFAAVHGVPEPVQALFGHGAAGALLGQTESARPSLETALALMRTEPRWYLEALIHLYLGRHFLLRDEFAAAEQAFGAARDCCLATGPEGWYAELYPEALALFVSVAVRQGHLEQAQALLGPLQEFADRFDSDYIRAFSDRAKAECLVREGRASVAVPLLHRCIGTWSRLGWTYETARTWVEVGRALAEGGDGPGGRAALSHALELFEEMSAVPDLDQTRALLSKISG
ncbi:MAG: AAA family ATPase [Thermoplasmata archaeon]|nr:AAA family ATPase [Thermoplasmata archaeon]